MQDIFSPFQQNLELLGQIFVKALKYQILRDSVQQGQR
jgi:hypothetical protein